MNYSNDIFHDARETTLNVNDINLETQETNS